MGGRRDKVIGDKLLQPKHAGGVSGGSAHSWAGGVGWAVSRIRLLCLRPPCSVGGAPELLPLLGAGLRGTEREGRGWIQLGCGRLGRDSLHLEGRVGAGSLLVLPQELVGLARSPLGPGQPWLRKGLVVLGGDRYCQLWQAQPTVQGLTGPRAASVRATCVHVCTCSCACGPQALPSHGYRCAQGTCLCRSP